MPAQNKPSESGIPHGREQPQARGEIAPTWARYSSARRWSLLGILWLVTTSASIDRVIISVVLEPIKKEFGVSDTLLGLLSGMSFALFYACLGLPIARLADIGNRKRIIALSLAVWSVMTALCGLAGNFWQLLLMRIGVGAGEAGCLPAAQSLMVEYFSPSLRARAISIFGTGATAGYVLGLIVGSHLVVAYGWRTTLILLSLPGLGVLVFVCWLLDEPRAAGVTRGADADGSFGRSLRELLAKRSYQRILLGFALYNALSYGTLLFVPAYLTRVLHVPAGAAGFWYGTTSAVGVALGGLAGGYVVDTLCRRSQRWLVEAPALGYLLALAPCVAMFLVNGFTAFLILSTVAMVLLNAAIPATFLAAHGVCGDQRRAVAVAAMLFCGNLFGLGLGPVVTGVLSDALSRSLGPDGLRYALVLMMLLLIPTGVALFSAGGIVERELEP